MSRKKKNKGVPNTTQIVVRTPAPQTNVPNKAKKKNKKKRSKNLASVLAPLGQRVTESFKWHLLRPDLLGPFRQPRFGSSDRTGLAIDRTRIVLTGSANLVQGIQANSTYTGNVGAQYAVATTATALTAGSGYTVGTQFPSGTQIADINVTAVNLVISYTGNPLNVAGEIIFGASIPLSASATYNSVFFYPGVMAVPIAELITNPLTVSMRKLSERANEFVAPSGGIADLDLPFFLTNGLPTGQTLLVEQTRTFEYRSTTADGSVVPYERHGESTIQDVGWFQNAVNAIGDMVSPVTSALPAAIKGFTDAALSEGGFSDFGEGLSPTSIVHTLGSLMNARYQADRRGGQLRLEL
jgi:hypothetical protein